MEDFEWELKRGFLADAKDLLAEVDETVASWREQQSLTESDLNLIFRLVHTLKGNSNACGMEPLGKATHRFEDVLILARKEIIPRDFKLLELSQHFCDVISDALESYGKNLNSAVDFSELENAIEKFVEFSTREKNVPQEKSENKILIIDDDVDFSNYIALFIKKEFQLQCDIAHNGAEGLEKALVNNYECVICDYEMPLMKGTDFVEKLRATTGPNQHTMVLFTSAYSRLQFFPSDTGVIEDVVFINKPVHLPRFVYYLKFGLKKNRGF